MISHIYSGVVKRVVDGDTYDIAFDLGFGIIINQRIRLADVDTPETWRPKSEAEREHGKKATEFVKELIEGKNVIIKSVKRGKYRYVGEIYCIGENDELSSVADLLTENDLLKRDNYDSTADEM